MNMILNLYALCWEIRDARLMFDKMLQRDVVMWNIVMTLLMKRGDIEEAYDLISGMPDRSVRSWTLMISGFG
ncbi:putative pentatricopeptide [Rosa chinensis]|uniref:Putative pentatricopeptide n=1 Tax=Rosa chinensis TaxID=74649 RepID=A0A2P6PC89_ROSCH|nr:putative pentatricopeptide [Rosa chinensis]